MGGEEGLDDRPLSTPKSFVQLSNALFYDMCFPTNAKPSVMSST